MMHLTPLRQLIDKERLEDAIAALIAQNWDLNNRLKEIENGRW